MSASCPSKFDAPGDPLLDTERNPLGCPIPQVLEKVVHEGMRSLVSIPVPVEESRPVEHVGPSVEASRVFHLQTLLEEGGEIQP